MQSARALAQRVANRDVELGDVLVVDRRADVGQVVVERGVELLRRRDDDRRPRVDQLEERAEAIGRQELGQRPLGPVLVGVGERLLGEDPVVGVDLGGRIELDPLDLRERALGEGREVADRLDLVAEQLDPRGLVARSSRRRRGCRRGPRTDRGRRPARPARSRSRRAARRRRSRSTSSPFAEREAGRAQRGVGNRLGERDGAGDDDRRLASPRAVADERVERGDPQADEVRRRRQVGLVAGAARRVVADAAGRQVGAELGRRDRGRRGRRRRRRAPGARRGRARPRRARRAGTGAGRRRPAPRRARRRRRRATSAASAAKASSPWASSSSGRSDTGQPVSTL